MSENVTGEEVKMRRNILQAFDRSELLHPLHRPHERRLGQVQLRVKHFRSIFVVAG